MHRTILKLLIMLFGSSLTVFSQDKFEKEYRIKAHEVPKKAIEFIEKCNFHKKVKWYIEESQDGKTYEAKSVKNSHKFSIEFDLKGNILDVEKKKKHSELSKQIQVTIDKALSKQYVKYRIKKIQVQWSGEDSVLIALVNKESLNKEIKVNYEIVIKGKKKSTFSMYEVLIDETGKILREQKIVPLNSDNLHF